MEEISKNPEKEQGAAQKENFDDKAKKSFWSSYVQKEIENAINPLAQFTKNKEKDSKENVQPTKEEILDKLFDKTSADECADVVFVPVETDGESANSSTKTTFDGMTNPSDNQYFRPIIAKELSPRDGETGVWNGNKGDSTWKPNPDYVPPDIKGNTQSNPDHSTMEELWAKYGKDVKDGIPFKDGEVDFSDFSQGEVEIDNFTTNRAKNFQQADLKLAEERGCTPEEIAKFRKENNCTWHECKDQKTMQLVPNEIHANIPHNGGISECKKSEVNKNES